MAETQKVQVKRDGKAVLECPHCRSARIVDVSMFRSCRGLVRVRCICRLTYCVSLEWRREFRKKTYLDGFYRRFDARKQWGKMVVRNISGRGIGFTTLGTHTLSQGDQVRITFPLDPHRNQDTARKGLVKVVRDNYVGCEFSETSRPFSPGPSHAR